MMDTAAARARADEQLEWSQNFHNSQFDVVCQACFRGRPWLPPELFGLEATASELARHVHALADEVDRLQAIEKAAKQLSVMHGSSFGLPTLSQSNLDAAVEAWADLRAALAASASLPVTP